MSNSTTNFITYNQNTGQYQDLSGIFQPLESGTPIGYNVGFTTPNNQDLSQIFLPLTQGSQLSYNVGFEYNGNDLSNIFSAWDGVQVSNKNSFISISKRYNVNNTGYTVYTFTTRNPGSTNSYNYTNGTCNINFNFDCSINIILVGGGGASQPVVTQNPSFKDGNGGAGGGNTQVLTNIGVTTNSQFQITVGSGGIPFDNTQRNGIGSSFGAYYSAGGPKGNGYYGGKGGYNGGNGGDGGSNGTGGGGTNGTYSSYVTQYGDTLQIGGGGGGGYGGTNVSGGYGNRGNNGIAGQYGTSQSNYNPDATSYGSGGGGGGYSSYNMSSPPRGYGGSGLVVVYWIPN